jgi:hypothetical protein
MKNGRCRMHGGTSPGAPKGNKNALKRIDLPYRPGPSKSWIKVKNKAHPAMLRVKEAFELERARRA